MSMFVKATKQQAKLRLALLGPAGSGKTYTALRIAQGIGGPIAVVDTEHGSASKYADQFDFLTCPLTSFDPDRYIAAIAAAEQASVNVLILDSLSHAWAGKDGILEFVDRAAKKSPTGNSFGAWRDATPKHNALVEAILGARLHVIATMRVKMEYVQEKNERTGKTEIRKVGLQPIQRDGLEYEFDVVGDLTLDNDLVISKTRASFLRGQVIAKPGEALGQELLAWLSDGAAPAATPATRDVTINGKVYTTAGVDKETLLTVWNLSETFNRLAATKEAAKQLLRDRLGKGSSLELTAEDGVAFVALLREQIATKEAAIKAQLGGNGEGRS